MQYYMLFSLSFDPSSSNVPFGFLQFVRFTFSNNKFLHLLQYSMYRSALYNNTIVIRMVARIEELKRASDLYNTEIADLIRINTPTTTTSTSTTFQTTSSLG